MAKTQWHPVFAELLKIQLQDYYEVQTEVTVGELPRRADVFLVRRQEGPTPPFKGLWSHLTDWNVIEFKGRGDDPEPADLELLFHVGTGLTCKLNEDRRAAGLAQTPTEQVSFWFVASKLGDTFLGDARLRARFEYEMAGVMRATVWGHPVFLVAGGQLPVEEDTVPVMLLEERAARGLGKLLVDRVELVRRFQVHLATLQPRLWQEVRDMANEKGVIDWEEVAKLPDVEKVIPFLSREKVLGKLGDDELFDAMAAEQMLDLIQRKLPPTEWQQLYLTRMQHGEPKPEGDADKPAS